MVIFSKPKTGKTSAFAELKDSLILDLEKGSDFIDAVKIHADSLTKVREIGESIIKNNYPYKYIIVDTVTKLEDLCLPVALAMYKGTPIGRNFQGSTVLDLPNGAGYYWLRLAVESAINYIDTLAPRIIYSGHIKVKFIEKEGKEVQSVELDLTGKIRSWLSANSDAIGLLYRDKDKNILSFKTSDDVICGARPDHLKNQNIVLSEIVNDKLVTYWDKIYVD